MMLTIHQVSWQPLHVVTIYSFCTVTDKAYSMYQNIVTISNSFLPPYTLDITVEATETAMTTKRSYTATIGLVIHSAGESPVKLCHCNPPSLPKQLTEQHWEQPPVQTTLNWNQ